MKRPLLDHKRWRRMSALVFLVLSLALAACDQGSGNGSGSASVATKPWQLPQPQRLSNSALSPVRLLYKLRRTGMPSWARTPRRRSRA